MATATMKASITNYADAAKFANGTRRKLGHNTDIVPVWYGHTTTREPDAFYITYHGNLIAEFHPIVPDKMMNLSHPDTPEWLQGAKSDIVLTTAGWNTPTTTGRLAQFLPDWAIRRIRVGITANHAVVRHAVNSPKWLETRVRNIWLNSDTQDILIETPEGGFIRAE